MLCVCVFSFPWRFVLKKPKGACSLGQWLVFFHLVLGILWAFQQRSHYFIWLLLLCFGTNEPQQKKENRVSSAFAPTQYSLLLLEIVLQGVGSHKFQNYHVLPRCIWKRFFFCNFKNNYIDELLILTWGGRMWFIFIYILFSLKFRLK